MEEFDAAEQLLSAYVALNPVDAPVLTALARVYEVSGNPEKAEETLLQLMDMNEENDAEITEQLLAVQVTLEKYSDALTFADDLLEQTPANVAVRRLRVQALTELGEEEEAAAELDRIQRLLPDADATVEVETADVEDGALAGSGTEFAAAAP